MVKTAFIFPGQGSQSAGMGRKIIKISSIASAVDECSEASGLPLRDFILNYSDRQLKETNFAQPAIFALSVGMSRLLIGKGIQPNYVAGHSLGHFSALVTAGCLELVDGAKLVAIRGELMARSGEKTPGFMAAIQRVKSEEISTKLSGSGLKLWVANRNLADQTIISGCKKELATAKKIVASLGGGFSPLNVSGAFHSPLLAQEQESFAEHINRVKINEPSIPVLCNTTGSPLMSAKDIRENLVSHMTSCVNWIDVMDRISSERVCHCIETGPGKVLTGLFMKHNREVNTTHTIFPDLSIKKNREMMTKLERVAL